MRLNPFRKSRAGEPYVGAVIRTAARELVKWPGVYGVKDGHIDPKTPLRESADGGWERVN